MAEFRRATLSGGRSSSSRNVLGRIRDVQIISEQLALPLLIIESVLDYLSVPDLIRFARTSKRMRDLVYDDTRWVKKLRQLGCWNEAEARASVDPNDFDTDGSHGRNVAASLKRMSLSQKPPTGAGAPTVVITNASNKTNTELLAEAAGASPSRNEKDGFAEIPLSTTSSNESGRRASLSENAGNLNIFETVRSVRGRARQEYGKIYGALRPFYKDALRIKNPSSAKIFRSYRDPKQQAQMLVQLQTFAKSDSSPGEASREERLGAILSAFEDAVANEFDQGLEIEDVDGRMKKYADVLIVLNGGKRAVNQFFAHNRLLKNEANLGDPSDCINATNSDNIFIEEIHRFCSRLASAVNHQINIMTRVFQSSVEIIGPFMSRLGDHVITPYVNELLNICHQRSTEAYLRAISASYQQLYLCSQAFEFPNHSKDELSSQFTDILTELYSPHFGTYLAEELALFKRKSEAEISGWEQELSQQDSSIESLYMTNVNRQADKRDFMSSFRKVVMMPVNALPNFPMMGTWNTASKSPLNGSDTPKVPGSASETPRSSTPSYTNRMSRSPSRPLNSELPTTELAAKAAIMKARLEGIGSLFSLEMALSLVHLAKASIERLAAFTLFDNDFAPGARSQAETIFAELVKALGDRHVRAGFDKAVDHLAEYNPRAEGRDPGQSAAVAPLAMFLELVNVGDLIQQMLDVFFEQELVAARLTDKQDFLNPTVKGKKKFEQMLDERVAAGLNKGIEVLVAEVDYQLATQKPDDYNPEATGQGESQIMDIGPSITARNVVELISSHTSMLAGSTEKTLLDVFNQEVGLRLYHSFCKHLKRQRISVSGAIRLISDTNHYYSFIITLKNKDLNQYFNALRELSQIYLIGPEDAKELATVIADADRFRGIIGPEEVYEFTERRADWYQIRAKVERAMYGAGCVVM